MLGSRVLAMLQVTPNGPWGTEVHPSMPISLPEVLAQVRSCLVAGADSVHLHVRDACGAETLDPALVNEACARVREVAAELGVDVEVGLTTGAWIEPDLAQGIAMIREWEGVDCATVNLSETGFEQVMAAMGEVGIGVDIGLWAPVELDRLFASGVLANAYRVSIELDPGEPYRLTGDPVGIASELCEALDDAGSRCPRLIHGAGAWTWPLVEEAFRRGDHTRVGFEDSLLLPDGRRASDNAELVRAAVRLRQKVT